MKKFLSKVLKTVTKQSSFYLCLLLILSIISSLINPIDGLFVNLLASLICTVSVLIIDSWNKYKKLIILEGTYDSYLYEEEDYKKINLNKSIGVYKVSYESGNTIMVKKIESFRKNYEDHLWEGKAEISDAYIGQLSWKYYSPDDWADFAGFKEIIIPESKKNNMQIYLFGLDEMIKEREVLIKRPE